MKLSKVKIISIQQLDQSDNSWKYIFIKFLCVVLDWEVETGLQSVDEAPPEEHCHCYKRLIPDLYNNLKNEHAPHYTDLLKGQAQLDPVLKTAQQEFIDQLHRKVFSLLEEANIQMLWESHLHFKLYSGQQSAQNRITWQVTACKVMLAMEFPLMDVW